MSVSSMSHRGIVGSRAEPSGPTPSLIAAAMSSSVQPPAVAVGPVVAPALAVAVGSVAVPPPTRES
jgi:hypothetical protein